MNSNSEVILRLNKDVKDERYYPYGSYIESFMYDEQHIMAWLNEIIEFLHETNPKDFPRDKPIKFKIQSAPISLINNIEVLINEIKHTRNYIDLRSDFEADILLKTKFAISDTNGYEEKYHKDNSKKLETLIRYITNSMMPRQGQKSYSNKNYKVLSGSTYFICNNLKFINVLKGKFPDGRICKKRFFKEGITEEDVEDHRAQKLEEFKEYLYTEYIDTSYIEPTVEDIKDIFLCFPMDKNKLKASNNLKEFVSYVFKFSLDFANVLNKVLIGEKFHDFDIDVRSESMRDKMYDSQNYIKEFSTYLFVKGKTTTYMDYFLSCYDFSEFSDVFKTINFFESLLQAVIVKVVEGMKLRQALSILREINIIFPLFLKAVPHNPKSEYEIDPDYVEDFLKYGSETVASYVIRLKKKLSDPIHVLYIENALIEIMETSKYKKEYMKTRKDIVSHKAEKFAGGCDINFSSINLKNTILTVLNGSTNTQSLESIIRSGEELNSKKELFREQIELEIDNLAGECSIVQAVEIPKLDVIRFSKIDNWFKNKQEYIKGKIKKIFESSNSYISKTVFDDMFEQILKDYKGEGIKQSDKKYEYLPDISYFNLLSNLELYIIYSNPEVNQPIFTEFKLKSMDIEMFMEFDITDKKILLKSGSASVKDIFYEPSDKMHDVRKIKQGGKRILIDHFTDLFLPFGYINPIKVDVKDTLIKDSQRIILSVNFSSIDETFICTKFCTNCFTSNVENLINYFGIEDPSTLDKEYSMIFKKTPKQYDAFSGIDNSKTKDFYSRAKGCEENYPFVNNTYDLYSPKIVQYFSNYCDRISFFSNTKIFSTSKAIDLPTENNSVKVDIDGNISKYTELLNNLRVLANRNELEDNEEDDDEDDGADFLMSKLNNRMDRPSTPKRNNSNSRGKSPSYDNRSDRSRTRSPHSNSSFRGSGGKSPHSNSVSNYNDRGKKSYERSKSPYSDSRKLFESGRKSPYSESRKSFESGRKSPSEESSTSSKRVPIERNNIINNDSAFKMFKSIKTSKKDLQTKTDNLIEPRTELDSSDLPFDNIIVGGKVYRTKDSVSKRSIANNFVKPLVLERKPIERSNLLTLELPENNEINNVQPKSPNQNFEIDSINSEFFERRHIVKPIAKKIEPVKPQETDDLDLDDL